ncbi:DNA-processing protein DprA [Rubritalea spongiae]|uniref:DNA-processing protein DprA n=1 Tax=Rubritalea spongiae TaxID=430797 RepID=A0ABW5E3N2_9BACT
MNSREALIALNMLPKIGPIRVRRLLENLGSAEAILKAPSSQLIQVQGIGPETAQIISHWDQYIDLSAELNEASKRNITILTQEDSDYPSPLRNMYDPPLALYIWGEIEKNDKHAIAVVGSRRTTHYGQHAANKLTSELARSGFTIISGLARGIDTFAHQAALDAKGRTIAILGSGLAQLYPPQNMHLAERIADGNGAIISEFPLHTAPDKKTFPMRNRIVAAWSSAILVCECPQWSGSIITANLGAEMGKTIYAVPGPIDRPTSAGCNQLIRDGATLVSSSHDILEDFETLPLHPQLEIQPDSTPTPELDPTEQQILQVLSKDESLIDTIVERTQLPVPIVISTLLKLEMKRLILQLPGARYILR